MNNYLETLRKIADAVYVVNASSFTWFGSASAALPENIGAEVSVADRRAFLHATLRDKVYRDAYCPGEPRAAGIREAELTVADRDSTLRSRIAEANAGTGSWEPGWTVVSVADRGIASPKPDYRLGRPLAPTIGVEAKGLRIWVRKDEYRFQGRQPALGDKVEVRLPRGSFDISPGYYSAFSDVPMESSEVRPILRLYLAVSPNSAPLAMTAVTETLNKARIPFRFKVLLEYPSYNRSDAAVLYLYTHDAYAAAQPIAEAVVRISTLLEDVVPAFTYRAAAGVGLAEEPGSRESFGESRSSLVAEGIIRRAEEVDDVRRRGLDSLLEPWAEAGISLDVPYLNPSSSGEELKAVASAIAQWTPTIRRADSIESAAASFSADKGFVQAKERHLEVAKGISAQLVNDAVWHEDRCTWLGMVPASDERGKPALCYGSIGSSLYDGGAGVGLFLALMGAVDFSSEAATQTAIAAGRQSLRSISAHSPQGLFTGAAGTVLAATAIGTLANNNNLLELAAEAADSLRSKSPSGSDLLSGRAGAVLAFLCLAQLLNDDLYITDAERIGKELLEMANVGTSGSSWPNDADQQSPDLTGLSHGAAGIGAAFIELWQATGKDIYSAAAEEAFRYERSWYSKERGDWPDLREANRQTARSTPQPFLDQWCHGAPGIALSRVRAANLLRDPVLVSEAVTAIETTVRSTAVALSNPNFSFCLCHGLAGNAEVLLESLGGSATGLVGMSLMDATRSEELITRIASQGYLKHFRGGQPWTCGVPVSGVHVPGLMLGAAGIGYHYLRLAKADCLPSILLPQPDEFVRRLRGLSHSEHELSRPLS